MTTKGKHGHSGKSPKFRHAAKREAERNEARDKSRIREPKASVSELFRPKPKINKGD